MKRVITSIVAVLMLSTLALGQSKFDNGVVDKSKFGDLKKPLPAGGLVLEALAGLEIKQVSATSGTSGITVTGVLHNAAKVDITAGWTLMKWDGSSWLNLRKGSSVLVPAKGTKEVTIELPATNEAMRFRWAVSWTKPSTLQVAKEFRLAAKRVVFVVRYGTHKSADWWLAREWKNDLSDGFDASQLARKLGSFGFATQIKKKKTTGIDTWFSSGSSIHTWLSVRIPDPIERTFDTRDEAVKFRDALNAVTKFPGVFVESIREK